MDKIIRSDAEIAEQIKLLKEYRERVRPRTHFGDDNRATIDAEIAVLEGRMDYGAVCDEFDPDGDNSESYDFQHARDASDWLFEDSEEFEAPAEGWKDLLIK